MGELGKTRYRLHIGGLLFNERGSATVLVALLATALIGLSALVIDTGRIFITYANMRNAVDAAALAGAQQLPDTAAAFDSALSFAKANGLQADEVIITVPYQEDERNIEVKCQRMVDFLLAPVLGVNHRLVTARAVARYGGNRVFDYALFSGSKTQNLQLSGGNIDIQGNAHTNQNAKFTGCNVTIDGCLEAVGTIMTSGANKQIIEEIPDAPYVATPKWDMNELRSKASSSYVGDQHFMGNLHLEGITFVEGDVHLNGCSISGTGSIVATGDIIINGANIQYLTDQDALCLYAGNSIKISGANTRVDGILYAPNFEIQMSGANIHVKGAVIADTVQISGSNMVIEHDSHAVYALPQKSARLID